MALRRLSALSALIVSGQWLYERHLVGGRWTSGSRFGCRFGLDAARRDVDPAFNFLLVVNGSKEESILESASSFEPEQDDSAGGWITWRVLSAFCSVWDEELWHSWPDWGT